MALNIKNQRVHDLATEAARVTGRTKTGAIEEALEKLLLEYGAAPLADDREARLRELIDIGRRVKQSHPELRGDESLRWQEELYDADTGLPS